MSSKDLSNVVETMSLSKRFGSTWALRDCSVSIPVGRITALVGPNGAGKSTLLRFLVGLSRPTQGEARVCGLTPSQSPDFLSNVGYLAQEAPLYRRLSVAKHLELGAVLNRNWDGDSAKERLNELHIPFDRPVATLSGGQRSQVALSLALAKRPRILFLDEPVAALDPLARREFLASLTAAVSDADLSVVMSSHLVHDLERICDHLVLLANAHTQLSGDIDGIIENHKLLTGTRRPIPTRVGSAEVISATETERQVRLLVRLDGPMIHPDWQSSELSLEEIVLGYMSQSEKSRAGLLRLEEEAS